MSALKPNVIFVLGPPGSGKGTQSLNICRDYGYVHLSAGDLLREERNTPNSQYGELIEHHIRNGTIVPVEITCKLIEKAMQKHVQNKLNTGDNLFGSGRFLIDGFPRNEDNLDGWTRSMSDNVNVQFVLFFNCDEDICVDRCLKRGAAGSGRSDDNEESLRKRMNTYVKDTLPIIQYYEKLNLVKKVDAASSPDSVYESVKKLFDSSTKEL